MLFFPLGFIGIQQGGFARHCALEYIGVKCPAVAVSKFHRYLVTGFKVWSPRYNRFVRPVWLVRYLVVYVLCYGGKLRRAFPEA